MVALRQRHGKHLRHGGNEHHGGEGNCPIGRPERRRVRVCRGKNEPSGLPRVGGAGYVYVQAGLKRVAAGWNRPHAPGRQPLISDQKPPKRVYTLNPRRRACPLLWPRLQESDERPTNSTLPPPDARSRLYLVRRPGGTWTARGTDHLV